jgi:uncharacterized membrane protein YphA (DoxX/SURF4 family)
MRFSANPMQVDAFNNVYSYGTVFMYVTGTIEVVSAIGLLVGYWKKVWYLFFSGLLTVIMAGAVFAHLNAGQGFGIAMMPFILLLFAIVVFFGQRKIIHSTKLV